MLLSGPEMLEPARWPGPAQQGPGPVEALVRALLRMQARVQQARAARRPARALAQELAALARH